MNKWLKINKDDRYKYQLDKIKLRNKFLHSSYLIINKMYVKFFQSLKSINSLKVKLKLLLKFLFYLIFK